MGEKGHQVERQALRTGLRRHGRQAVQPKAFSPCTTDPTHGRWGAPNLLLDQPHPTRANREWVSDITYLPLANGHWTCLCAFQDGFTKHVVGWQVRTYMLKTLFNSALQRALLAQRPVLPGTTPGLIIHSDRGRTR